MTSELNMGKIAAIKAVREKCIELGEALVDLSRPMLDDFSLLSEIHNAYVDVFRERGCPGKAAQVYHRKKFLLVALYLYSPGTLTGERMRIGLRRELADVLNLTTGTAVSDNCASLLFHYNNSRDFRRDCGLIYRKAVEKINIKNVNANILH